MQKLRIIVIFSSDKKYYGIKIESVCRIASRLYFYIERSVFLSGFVPVMEYPLFYFMVVPVIFTMARLFVFANL